MSAREHCAICGLEHAPLKRDPRETFRGEVYYATQPGTPEHAREVEWFARHGVIAKGLKCIEAFCLAHSDPKRF